MTDLEKFIKRATLCDEALRALEAVLGNVDYTHHCCNPTAMVAAALPVDVLDRANAVLKKAREL